MPVATRKVGKFVTFRSGGPLVLKRCTKLKYSVPLLPTQSVEMLSGRSSRDCARAVLEIAKSASTSTRATAGPRRDERTMGPPVEKTALLPRHHAGGVPYAVGPVTVECAISDP